MWNATEAAQVQQAGIATNVFLTQAWMHTTNVCALKDGQAMNARLQSILHSVTPNVMDVTVQMRMSAYSV